MTRLVVVGAGIAGLAAAWFAHDAGIDDVVVLEAAPRVGGKLLTRDLGGVTVDVGAEAMLAARPEGVALLAAVGLADETLAPSTTSANVRAGGRVHPLPGRTMLGIPGDVDALRASGVLDDAALDRVLAEPSQPPLPPLLDDVAVGRLVRDRLGDEVADRLVDPLLGGVYAGRADDLSLRATIPALAVALAPGGSLLEAANSLTGVGPRPADAPPVFASLRGGLGRLPEVLAASGRFEVRTGVTVRGIERAGTGFVLHAGAVPATERIDADAVIVAAPAAKAARLVGGLAPDAARELAGMDYASVAIASFVFDADDAPEVIAGSGLLVAAGERLATKAVTLTSQKWPIDTGDRLVLRASVGRHGEPEALRLDDTDLLQVVRGDLRTLLGIDAVPEVATVTRWGGGLPQYASGHVERVGRIRAAITAVPALDVCGAAYDGVGVPACIGSARTAVDRVVRDLDAPSTIEG